MSELNTKLAIIQTELKAEKSKFNSFGKYKYRSAEDILEALKPYIKSLDVNIIIQEELINSDTFPILKSTAILTDGENQLSARALVGVDLEQKGMQMPQRFGAASSYGKKYALGNLFLIDDTADPDSNNTHDKKSNSLEDNLNKEILRVKEFVNHLNPRELNILEDAQKVAFNKQSNKYKAALEALNKIKTP